MVKATGIEASPPGLATDTSTLPAVAIAAAG